MAPYCPDACQAKSPPTTPEEPPEIPLGVEGTKHRANNIAGRGEGHKADPDRIRQEGGVELPEKARTKKAEEETGKGEEMDADGLLNVSRCQRFQTETTRGSCLLYGK